MFITKRSKEEKQYSHLLIKKTFWSWPAMSCKKMPHSCENWQKLHKVCGRVLAEHMVDQLDYKWSYWLPKFLLLPYPNDATVDAVLYTSIHKKGAVYSTLMTVNCHRLNLHVHSPQQLAQYLFLWTVQRRFQSTPHELHELHPI